TRFPEYADRHSQNNQAVEMIRLKIRDLKLLVRGIGVGFLILSLILFLLLRVIYGSGESRFQFNRWLYRLFNKDNACRQVQTLVHSFTPIQRKVFEMSFAASKGNPDGSFDLDILKWYKMVFPTDDEVSERKRANIAIAFYELCEEFFFFQMTRANQPVFRTYCPIIPFEDQVTKEFVRDLSGREVEVYKAGRFRFSPPLYQDFLRHRYPRLPHPVTYAIDDKKHPYAFRLYILLWELWYDQNQREDKRGMTSISINLNDLLNRVCVEMVTSPETNLLEQLHLDIAHLKDFGAIRTCVIEEHGEKVAFTWPKEAELFVYDATINQYRQNSHLLVNKKYSFEMVPWDSLEKLKPTKRRCAYLDEFDTPCTRPAIQGSPYCKRHAKVLEHDAPRLFYGKVKFLPPGNADTKTETESSNQDSDSKSVSEAEIVSAPEASTPAQKPTQEKPPEVIITPPPAAPDADPPMSSSPKP
ncbi:MAG TPA: hypothetical protein PKO06_19250, partial [Candidatus Ozemobacteraceae bacterium]|nr:hypothetical protein [Candidatus Ozemobacteraceae bacterium]